MKPLNEELDKKKLIAEKYNSTSKFYDDRYKKIQNDKYRIQFKDANFQHRILLDAGCGTGLFFEYLSALFENRIYRNIKFVGIDISLRMLLHFSKKTKEQQNIRNVNLILGDLENLPFRKESFNMVISVTSLQNLQDLKKGLNELIRVGKESADLKLSILHKQINLEDIISHLNSHTVHLQTTIIEELEDVIVQGNLSKVEYKT